MFKRVADSIKRHDWFSVSIEFAIVVLGIFLALQADSWNQSRADRALEREYLKRLAADTEWNIKHFKSLEQIFEIKARTIATLKDTPAGVFAQSNPDSFLDHIEYSTYVALPSLRSETFDELESSGRLLLLRSVELRSELSSHYADYALMQEILDEPVGDYRRLFYEHVPGEEYLQWRLTGTLDDVGAVIDGLEALQSNPSFEAAANAEIAYAASLVYWLKQHRERATRVLSKIE